eukprot:TRINITY_DN3823_c0_g4_i1.p1 TRINITY_DN3823_c0_g4~~TRINITY_DN3823_c0_g4_i1.p1  ORF type:complete len:174 (-),score=19.07 TRINITY_DN3823_c0_g4_i1:51-572(-)
MYSMYLKESSSAATQRYISIFGSARHTAGIKQKYTLLKSELIKRILELGVENKDNEGEDKDNSPEEAFKFMKPYIIDFKGEKLFYLIDKKQYSQVTVAWLAKRMRFTLAKVKMSPVSETMRDADVRHNSSAIIHLEAPKNYYIHGRYEDEHYKGLELRLEDIRVGNKGQWEEW